MTQAVERVDCLQIGTANGTPQAPPRIAAAFLVKFDIRKGYTVAWNRALPGLELEGVVDYKSLPSGLHNIKEDLVYFTHDEYAGVSAFLNEPAEESERNAQMISVGVLVPLDCGRMGKCWLHAEGLQELAKEYMKSGSTHKLEDYWNKYKLDSSPNLKSSRRASSLPGSKGPAEGKPPQHSLAQHHPALSLPSFVSAFGPLIFTLYRRALLRKRILLVGDAPVHTNCDFVYDLSVLSSIPRPLLSLLPIDGTPDLQLRPLFNVCVQDIDQLSAGGADTPISDAPMRPSWVACTTDDVISTKPELYDLLVVLPPGHTKNAKTKIYPTIVESTPSLSRHFPSVGLKATQRDARRYQTLRTGLRSMQSSKAEAEVELATDGDEEEAKSTTSDSFSTLSRTAVVESTPWSLVAYTSLMWWASAGEKRFGPTEQEENEEEQDRGLLMGDDEAILGAMSGTAPVEIAIVSYFHRLTSLMFTTISDAISRQDGEQPRRDSDPAPNGYRDEEGDEDETAASVPAGGDQEALLGEGDGDHDETVVITQEDMEVMGLDIWSTADKAFVEELVQLWWGRKAEVQTVKVECCGIRLL